MIILKRIGRLGTNPLILTLCNSSLFLFAIFFFFLQKCRKTQILKKYYYQRARILIIIFLFDGDKGTAELGTRPSTMDRNKSSIDFGKYSISLT